MICTLYLLYYSQAKSAMKVLHFTPRVSYREHLEQSFFRHDDTLKLLLLLDGKVRDLLKRGIISVGDGSGVKVNTTPSNEIGI